MNVFKRELKANWKGILFWSVAIIILIWTSMIKYSTLNINGNSVSELMAQFPHSIQVIFGISGFDLSKISGYYGVMFMYIALLGTIHAVLLGSGIISKEERDKTSEFLFSKPSSRFRIITAKLLAGFVNIAIVNLVITFSSIYFVGVYGKGEPFISDISLLMLALFCLQIIFFFVGTAVASVVRRAKAASSTATGVLLFTFILTFIINLSGKIDYLKYLTPFKYFDAKTIMADGHLDPAYLIISAVLLFIMILLTYRAYQAKDLSD